jgi:hypothetical protein
MMVILRDTGTRDVMWSRDIYSDVMRHYRSRVVFAAGVEERMRNCVW